MESFQRRVVATALALTIIGSSTAAVTGYNKSNEPVNKTKKTMTNYSNQDRIFKHFGPNSFESDVVYYLKVAKKLDNYDFSNITSVPKSIEPYTWDYKKLNKPEVIEYMIDLYEKEQNEDNKYLLSFILKRQKDLVNDFLNTDGYNVVYDDFANALKEYINSRYNLPTNTDLSLHRKKKLINENYTYTGTYIEEESSEEKTFTIDKNDSYIVDSFKLLTSLQHINGLAVKEKEELYLNALVSAIDLYEKGNIVVESKSK